MFLLFQLLSLIHYVSADLVHEPDIYYNTVDEGNMVAVSLWAMGICSCIGVVCKHKNKLPITITPEKHDYLEEEMYSIEKKDGKSIKGFKDNLDAFKKIIDRLYIEEKDTEVYIEKVKKGIEDFIDHDIIYMFGTGEIRYKENGKYYHGVGINEKQKWNKGNHRDKCIFEYIEGKKLPHPQWDSHNISEFCNDCSFDKEKTGKARNYKVYKCNGHCI